MDFTVVFNAWQGNVLNKPTRYVGIEHFDALDRMYKDKSETIYMETFKEHVNELVLPNVYVDVPEVNARNAHGAFARNATVHVWVHKHALNTYVICEPYVVRINHKMTECGFRYVLDEGRLLNDWLSAGCPTIWNIPDVFAQAQELVDQIVWTLQDEQKVREVLVELIKMGPKCTTLSVP